MAGEDLGDLLGKFLESLLNPQAPAGGKPPAGPGGRGPGQRAPGQRAPGQRGPGQRGPDAKGQWQQGQWQQGAGGRAPGRGEAVSRPKELGPSYPEPPLVEAEPVTGDDIAEQVERYLDPKSVSSRAERFGEEVALADDHLEAHQRELFGQGPRGGLAAKKLGTATAAPPMASAAAPSGIAQDVAALMRSPQNLRAAFLLGEILRRPEW